VGLNYSEGDPAHTGVAGSGYNGEGDSVRALRCALGPWVPPSLPRA